MAPPGAWWPLWEQRNVPGDPLSGGVSRGHIALPAAVFVEGERPRVLGPTQHTFIMLFSRLGPTIQRPSL